MHDQWVFRALPVYDVNNGSVSIIKSNTGGHAGPQMCKAITIGNSSKKKKKVISKDFHDPGHAL